MVLITGANGFLGFYLTQQLIANGTPVLATGRGACRLPFAVSPLFRYADMDFTDPYAVHDVFVEYQPTVVVHAGAMSKPDECELNQWECYRTNVEATLSLLQHSEEQNCFFLFMSTDFVFSGVEGMYTETDQPQPVNFYGRSKQDAEDAVKEYNGKWSIVRTVLVYGQPATGKQNLLTVVKEKIERKEIYKVFDDQFRTPTYVGDLVSGIIAIIDRKAQGIYHLSGNELMTPYQMAILTAGYLQLDQTFIVKAVAADFVQPAIRPPRTGLRIDKAVRELDYQPISFSAGLEKTFSKV